jgi:hypothetical protein
MPIGPNRDTVQAEHHAPRPANLLASTRAF